MDLRTPWTKLSAEGLAESANISSGTANPPALPEIPAAHYRPNMMRPATMAIVLVIALLAIVGLAIHHSHTTTASPPRPTHTAPALPAGTPAGHGLLFGTITANDGATLMMRPVLSKAITPIHTDHSTKILIPMNTALSQLAVGTNIAVFGTRYTDGSLTATVIIGGL